MLKSTRTDLSLGSRAVPLGARLASALLENPCAAAQAGLQLGKSLTRIALGKETETPRLDTRFSDVRWHQDGIRKRVLQAWQSTSQHLQDWIEQAPLSPSERQKFSFLAEQLSDALAPSNTPLHPAFADRLRRDGVAHLARSVQQWRHDFQHNHGLPRHINKHAFVLGEDLANTPGQVVFRQASYELIQYQPRTTRQHSTPLLIVPPQLNRFYIFDLSHERSLVRYALEAGIAVFIISWRNPAPEHRHWDLAHYSRALLEAIEITRQISQSPQVNLLGACLGGLTCALAQLQLQQQNSADKVRSCSYLVTPLDWRSQHPALLLLNRSNRERARLRVLRRGVLEGAEMARLFSWLRSKDLIWRYWTQNYLLGNEPEAFDVLHWNADHTRLPAALHSQLLELLAHESQPASLPKDAAGTPLNFSLLNNDCFALAGQTDHITPWPSVYRSMQLLGGECEFILANGGHIQAILNPARANSGHFQYAPLHPAGSEQWRTNANAATGSWWPHWLGWLQARSGPLQASPEQLGNANYPPLLAAPGSYVQLC